MAEFKLGRIRFVWQGTWVENHPYLVDDVVNNGGKSYICVISHTSASAFASDLAENPTYWELVSDGSSWTGNWLPTHYYNVGDLAKWGGIVYICKEVHTSKTFESPTFFGLEGDASKWDAFATSFNWTGNWTSGVKYKQNDFVAYGGITYVCTVPHIAGVSLQANSSSWSEFNQGIKFLGDWSNAAVSYKINDVVKYGGDLWICTGYHASSSTFDTNNFSVFVNGLQFENSWDNATVYQVGDVVTYGGYAYIAKQNGVGHLPSSAAAYWDLFTTGFNFRSDWVVDTAYRVGDVVRLGGYTYIAIADSVGQVPPDLGFWARLNSGAKWSSTTATYTGVTGTNVTAAGSSATFNVVRSNTVYTVTKNAGGTGYSNGTTIKILGTQVGGLSPVNDILITITGSTGGSIDTVDASGISVTWSSSVAYVLGDVVFWGASSYICVSAHIASGLNRPDADTTAQYWNLLSSGTEQAVLTTQGDTFYYGANGATRLPIGTDGQVLRVKDGLPEWAYYGLINNLVFVSPVGTDGLAADGWGLTVDKPWKSIRYACQQVENGYQHASATALLAKNKQFLMKEISNWVTYTYTVTVTAASSSTNAFTVASTANLTANMPIKFTGTSGGVVAGTTYYVKSVLAGGTDFTISSTITNGVAGSLKTLSSSSTPMTGSLVYDAVKCERDVGIIVDALVFDIGHGGNSKTVKAALSYYTAAGYAYITTNFGHQAIQTAAAYSYLSALVGDVLSNSAPASNYQTLNGATPTANQIIDSTLTVEADAPAIATNLVSIITSGILAGTATAIPTASLPNTTISVKTGTYTEILPIVVPSNTAIVGDELRSTVIQPQPAVALLAADKDKTISALNRIKAIVPDLISNTSITRTTGNTQTQVTTLPAGSAGSTAATAAVVANAELMYDIINNGNTEVPAFVITAPTGYNTSFLAGYGDGKGQIVQNTQYIKDEISAYLNTNYNPVWTALGSTGQANCQRDVGYIIDALTYDMTYGGNTQSLITGSAYYSYSQLDIASTELTAIIAAYGRLKTIIGQIVLGSDVTESSGNVTVQKRPPTFGVAGSAGSATFAQARVQDVIDWVTNGTAPATVAPTAAIALASSALQASYNALQAAKAEIQSDTVVWVKKYYQNINFDASTCSRDAGIIVDALSYDAVFGTNFNSIKVGMSYNRALTSTALVMSQQKSAELGSINFIKYKAKAIAGAGATAQISNAITDITGFITNGAVPRYTWPDFTGIDAENAAAAKLIWQNKEFLKAEVLQYITTNYPAVVYSQTICARDVGYIIDAIRYDMTYGGNYATRQAALAYYSGTTLEIASGEKAATIAAYNQLNLAVQAIATGGAYTVLNTASVARVTGTTGDATSGTTVGALIDAINNTINNVANVPAETLPSTSWVASTLTASNSALQSAKATIQANVIAYIDTNFPSLTYNSTTCSRDVGYIIDAIGYDFMMNSNYRSVLNGMSYYRAQAALVVGAQKEATLSAFSYLQLQIASVLSADATALARANAGMNTIIAILDKGVGETPEVHGTVTYNNTLATIKGAEILRANRTFLAYEATAWITDQFPSYVYDAAACRRDMLAYIDAIVYDLNFVGNYKGLRAARLYNNAVSGSEKENMFLVANGSGLRNCTLSGLVGSLTNPNSYGTKRPSAGAFVALNPGFGPNDSDVWVLTRSHYSQNVTMFGSGCVGAKIDGALHAGGNRSMVKNDFTTIISDGIGVWVTGSNALTELVSVFNYYGYAGYLAELGGKIRATNGNSSYGTYGVIAEGVDTYEVPKYGIMDNRANQAQITSTITDGTNQILRFEYGNAGNGYTNTVHTISGSGFNATAIGDEFRDGAVFETRIIDKNDGNGVGGTSYASFANAAQLSVIGELTIAATDTTLTDGYNGMRVQLTAGTGVGQYANILTYLNGSKVAKIYKDSFTNLTVTGSTDSGDTLTVASTATLYAGMPIYLGAAIAGASANTLYYVKTGFTSTTFQISTTGAGGTAVPITANTSGQTVTLYAAGWDHVIPGKAVTNTPDLTSAYVIEPRINYTAPGFKSTARTLSATATWSAATFGAGKYVAVASGSTSSSYSADGKTWASAGALTGTTTAWGDVVYGGGQGAVATAVIGGLGGSGAVLQAVMGTPNTTGAPLADQVASVTIINGGQNYTTPPTIVFTPTSGGSGAVATCTVLNGKIVSVAVSIPGSAYASAPTVTAATDRLTSISVVDWGKNYFSAPTITADFPAGLTPSPWVSLGTETLNSYVVTVDGNIYRVTAGGTAASTKPTHTSGSATDGSATLLWVAAQIVAVATLTNSGVSGYSITNYGAGYTTTPALTIVDPAAKFVAISSTSNANCYQTVAGLGTSWTAGTTTTGKTDLKSIAYGNGIYVAVGGTAATASVVSSTDGLTWIDRSANITALSAGTYSSVIYGNGVFVAINNGGTVTSYSANGNTWTAGGALPNVGSNLWNSIAYGNGRFVALQGNGGASTSVAYSIDNGATWTSAPAGVGSSQTWSKLVYGQGLFMAIATSSQVVATSPDGINWTIRATGMPSSSNWKALAFGNTGGNPLWVAASNTSGTIGASIVAGATALGRVKVATGVVTEVRMIEPGSAYPKGTVTATTGSTTDTITVSDTTNLVDKQPVEFTGCTAGGLAINTTYYVIGSSIVTNTSFQVSATAASSTPVDLTTATGLTGTYRAGPIVTVTDPNKVKAVSLRVRQGDGALGNPSFTNRGSNNATATASTGGDGYSDLYQPGTFINVANLHSLPVPGANVEFASLPGVYFKLVTVTNVLGVAGAYTATFQINPGLTVLQAPAHGDVITTRLNYSQVRLTGHDFLYIGTGNKSRTNYPFVDPTLAIQANQQLSSNGGRVFFTSTDQDGNFNVGNLFGVQQATGTATLNASAFNLSGLNSLQLGAVSIGVGSAIITQFSTDPYFTANSDNIVPTQRAIKAYITAQIGGGSSSLNVNTLTSGVVYIANNTISTTSGVQINVTSKMNFTGGIDGAPVALGFFMQK